MDTVRLFVLTCLLCSTWASVIPTLKENGSRTNDKTIGLSNPNGDIKNVNAEDNSEQQPSVSHAPDGVLLGKPGIPGPLIHRNPSKENPVNAATTTDGESQPNVEEEAKPAVVVPAQLILPVENTPVHMEIDADNDFQKTPENDSKINPLLRTTTGRRPGGKKPPPVNSNNENNKPNKPSNVLNNSGNPAKPHHKETSNSQKLDVKKSSDSPKPSSSISNRGSKDKPNKPDSTSGGNSKPEKPNHNSNSQRPPQHHTLKTESVEANPESASEVAVPAQSNEIPNAALQIIPNAAEQHNLVDSIEKEKVDGTHVTEMQQPGKDFDIPFSLPSIPMNKPPGFDVGFGWPPLPTISANIESTFHADVEANKELENSPVVSPDEKSPQSNADVIQSQLQAQMEQIQSQIQAQQQQTQSHLSEAHPTGSAINVDQSKIHTVNSPVEEISQNLVKPNSKLAGLPEKKEFHKQVVSENQYVIHVENVSHSTQSIVTSDPTQLSESVKLEIMKPNMNSIYLSSKDNAHAIIESLVSKGSSSPVKDVPSCKGKETSNKPESQSNDVTKVSEVAETSEVVANKPEELVYEVEEVVVEPEIVFVPVATSPEVPDSAVLIPSVPNSEIALPALEIPVDQPQATAQLPPNILQLLAQLQSALPQNQGINRPQALPAGEINSGTGTEANNLTSQINQAVLAMIFTALTNIQSANNANISFAAQYPQAGAASAGAFTSLTSSPFTPQANIIPTTYAVAYPQLIPYLAPYVLVNGYQQQGLPTPNLAPTTLEYVVPEEYSPSSQAILPDSDTFIEEVQGVSIVPLEEIELRDKLEKNYKPIDHSNIGVSNKEKPTGPQSHSKPQSSSNTNSRPQSSVGGAQNTVAGLSTNNPLPSVSVFGNKPQNSQNNPMGRPQQLGNQHPNKPQQLGSQNFPNADNPQQLVNPNPVSNQANPQQLGTQNLVSNVANSQQFVNPNPVINQANPQQLGISNIVSNQANLQQLGNQNLVSSQAQSEHAENESHVRPPYAAHSKPSLSNSGNNKPHGSLLGNPNPHSLSNSVSRPQITAGPVTQTLNSENNKPVQLQQQNSNNPNAFVLSTMGQFLENESHQVVNDDKVEDSVNSGSATQQLSKPPIGGNHATHGHGVIVKPLSGNGKPRPGGHGYLIPYKSTDNDQLEEFQPIYQIQEVISVLPSENSQTPTGSFEIVVNPQVDNRDIEKPQENEKSAEQEPNQSAGAASARPPKPGMPGGNKRPSKPSKPKPNVSNKPPNKNQFGLGLKKPVNKQEPSKSPQDVLGNSGYSSDKPNKPPGWQLPTWPSFAQLYHNFFGTRQRAAGTDEVIEDDAVADSCTAVEVGPRNKLDNRPLCGENLPKDTYTCEKLCTDSGFNVGMCKKDGSCVCSYSESSEIGLKMEFYYDRNMTSWEDYYPSYDSCSRCSCSNQCTEYGYFLGVCGNTCYCGRPFQNGVPLELYQNTEQLSE